MIPLHTPSIDNDDIKSVLQNLKSGWISTASSDIAKFEKKLGSFVDSKFSVALNSGTSALHMALLGTGVKKDEEVIVPTITFIATINSIAYIGAQPIFMDCDDYLNLDIDRTVEFLKKNTYQQNGHTYNKKTNNIIKAIIVVHTFGNISNFSKLKKICKKLNIKIIEDAAESLGSYFKNKNKSIHSGLIGDVGCFSFNGNKIITTGSGGAVVTKSKKIYSKILHLSLQAKKDQINFIHDEIGFNYRMNGFTSALGISQLRKIKKYLRQKKNIHNKYKLYFKNTSFDILTNPNHSQSNNWLNILKINDKRIRVKKNKLINYLNSKKIQARPIWKLNHLQKPYINYQKYKIKNAIKLYNKCICLPSSPNLSNQDIKYIVNTILNF